MQKSKFAYINFNVEVSNSYRFQYVFPRRIVHPIENDNKNRKREKRREAHADRLVHGQSTKPTEEKDKKAQPGKPAKLIRFLPPGLIMGLT